jgi:hypothetical protein
MPLGGYQGVRSEIYFASGKQKEEVKAIAKKMGVTLTRYILGLIEEDQSKHGCTPLSFSCKLHALKPV